MRLIWKLVGWCMYIACFIKSCSITCLFAPVWWKCFCYISLGCSIVSTQSGWLRWEKRVKYSVETNIDLVTPERHLVWNCFLPLLLSACNTSLLLWLEVSRAYHMRAFLLIFFLFVSIFCAKQCNFSYIDMTFIWNITHWMGRHGKQIPLVSMNNLFFSGIDDALSIDSNICLGAHGFFPQSFTLLRICSEHVWKLKK